MVRKKRRWKWMNLGYDEVDGHFFRGDGETGGLKSFGLKVLLPESSLEF